jgi:hypothetical protein
MKGHIVKFIPNTVTVAVARQALLARKHSPAMLFGAGIATAVTATVLACKATLQVEEILQEAEKTRVGLDAVHDERPAQYTVEKWQSDQRLVKIHLARDLTKLYAPAVGLGFVSIALLTGSHVVLTKRNASLAAAYAVVDRAFKEYRERVRDELGEDKDREFRYGYKLKEIIEEDEHGHEVKTVKRIAAHGMSGYARPFDQLNRHWSNHPLDNRTFIQVQQTWANDRLRAYGYLLLNDVYDSLGMERTKEGCVVGWVKDTRKTGGDGYVSFGLDENTRQVHDFMNGEEGAIWLDFNVDGTVYHLI